MTATVPIDRAATVRRGQRLTAPTLGYNSLEGILSLGAGLLAGSIALVGFGIDSFIEVTASVAAIWRLRWDADPLRRAVAERRSLRILNAALGWWWADPLAALGMAPLLAWEEAAMVRGRGCCDDCETPGPAWSVSATFSEAGTISFSQRPAAVAAGLAAGGVAACR